MALNEVDVVNTNQFAELGYLREARDVIPAVDRDDGRLFSPFPLLVLVASFISTDSQATQNELEKTLPIDWRSQPKAFISSSNCTARFNLHCITDPSPSTKQVTRCARGVTRGSVPPPSVNGPSFILI